MSSPPPPALTILPQIDKCWPSALKWHARLHGARLREFASAAGFGIDSVVEGQVESGDAGCCDGCYGRNLGRRVRGLGRDERVHEPRLRISVERKMERRSIHRGIYAVRRKRGKGGEHVERLETCHLFSC